VLARPKTAFDGASRGQPRSHGGGTRVIAGDRSLGVADAPREQVNDEGGSDRLARRYENRWRSFAYS